jgi:hypothetical protein
VRKARKRAKVGRVGDEESDEDQGNPSDGGEFLEPGDD